MEDALVLIHPMILQLEYGIILGVRYNSDLSTENKNFELSLCPVETLCGSFIGILSYVIIDYSFFSMTYLKKKPSDAVNIRAIETSTYLVIDIHKNEVLEKIEESKAFFQVLLPFHSFSFQTDVWVQSSF